MLREGDLVECGEVQGRIVDDCGPFGAGGQHLYAVRFVLEGSDFCVELPAEMLSPMRPRPVVKTHAQRMR